jgi:proteasome lid subunit RPN8/RPN11
MIEQIFEHAAKEAPRECCGLVIQDGDNEKYIPSENLHEDNFYHQLNSKIKYVVHSHYDEDCRPSQYDIDNCNAVGIPYLIVSYPQKETYILEPEK